MAPQTPIPIEVNDSDRPDELQRRIRQQEDRLSRLSRASLRIAEDLDFNAVLQGVVNSAWSLTSSRYGAITVTVEDGHTSDFIVSGMTKEERQGLWNMPEGLGFFEYLSGLTEPLRVSNIDNHLRELGMPEEIAEAVTWLCSDAASLVTELAMAVDGGLTAQ